MLEFKTTLNFKFSETNNNNCTIKFIVKNSELLVINIK